MEIVRRQVEPDKNRIQPELHGDGGQQKQRSRKPLFSRQRFMDRATRRETIVGLAHNVVQHGRDRHKEKQTQPRPARRHPAPDVGRGHGQRQPNERRRGEKIAAKQRDAAECPESPTSRQSWRGPRHSSVRWSRRKAATLRRRPRSRPASRDSTTAPAAYPSTPTASPGWPTKSVK